LLNHAGVAQLHKGMAQIREDGPALPSLGTVGAELDADGTILDPARAEWEAGSAFVTPPGLWHAHYNESGAPAHVIPIQDAGLHTYLRMLDIQFFQPNQESFVSLKQ
jgi:hypothetical protein